MAQVWRQVESGAGYREASWINGYKILPLPIFAVPLRIDYKKRVRMRARVSFDINYYQQ